MATETLSGPLGELRAVSTAGGGTALTTTATFIQLVRNTKHVFISPRNFSTAAVAKVAVNPWLTVLITNDNLASAPQDYSWPAQDADAATDVVLSNMDTLANGDFMLVGSHLPFRGVSIDVDATMAGSNSPALTVTYWDGQAWTTISATDGTSSGSKSMAVDGNVTWTIPAGTLWKAASLREIFELVGPSVLDSVYNSPSMVLYASEKLYWTRWVFSAQLNDTSVTLNSMLAMNRSTAYFEMVSGQILEEAVNFGFGGIGCVEALTDASTANLIVNVATEKTGEFN